MIGILKRLLFVVGWREVGEKGMRVYLGDFFEGYRVSSRRRW